MKYEIHNPTKAPRVIYDGISKNGKPDGTQTVYHIPAGDTRQGIELSDAIAKELIERTKGDGNHDSDLRLKPQRELEPTAPAKK